MSARRLRGRLLFVVFFLWPAVLVDVSGTPMTDSVLLGAIRLVDAGTFTLSDESDPARVFLHEAHDISVHGGKIYSGVAPGGAIVAAPFYAAFGPALGLFDDSAVKSPRVADYYVANARAMGQQPASHLKDRYLLQILLTWGLMAPLFATFLVRLFEWAVKGGCSSSQAFTVVAAVGVGSMALYYGSMYARTGLACLLIWHGVLSLAGADRASARRCLLAGSLFAIAISVDYPGAILVGLVLLFALPRMDRSGRTALVAPILVIGVLLAVYHAVCFGSPFATAYHHRFWLTPGALAERGLDLARLEGGRYVGMNLPSPEVMLRLAFGAYKGLFVYSPVLLVGLLGLVRAARSGTRRGAGAVGLVVFSAYLVFNSTMGTHLDEHAHLVWGGLSVLWGPRHLLAAVPFLAVGIAFVDWGRPVERFAAYAALVLSAAINLPGVMFSTTLMSTEAFSPQLDSPVRYALELLVRRGPRVPLLDAYQVAPPIQFVVLAVLTLVSAALLRVALAQGMNGRSPRSGRSESS